MFERISPKARRVAVLAFDGVVLGDVSTPIEIFGRARDASGAKAYEVRVCSARPQVHAGHVTLGTRWRLRTLRWADTIIVPGLERPLDGAPEVEVRALKAAIARGARVASICTGAFILARTGALDGLEATTHWRAAEALKGLHPSIQVDAGVLYVDHGQLLTSAGAAAGLDLCLHLVRRDLGAAVAARTARDAVMPLERAGGQAQFIEHATPDAEGTSMEPLLRWLEHHLGERHSLETMAKRAALSTRSLSRHFRRQVGMTPAAWLARARVRRAQTLLESTRRSIERIAADTGFGSPTVLRQHFARLIGAAPTVYRRSFSVPRAAV
ncbi:MAG: helix-turn-helix domain-containing protein [Myxococcaceae bacterium]|nr:helix-turn-helix domain-containing protein [Myxococcaceae bacterium]